MYVYSSVALCKGAARVDVAESYNKTMCVPTNVVV